MARPSHRLRATSPPLRVVCATVLFFLALLGQRVAAHSISENSEQLPRSLRQATCMNSLFKATPPQPIGPFYMNATVRSNITEGKDGVHLTLTLVVKDKNCKPFPSGARVSIWHTDAKGIYSGFQTRPEGTYVVDERNEDFMRGDQLTDDNGTVVFRTIIPGWYSSRTIHIHLRVLYDNGHKELITQLYFDTALIEKVVQHEAYKDRGNPDTTNADDLFVGERPDLLKALQLDTKPDGANAYKATYVVGINTVVAENATTTPSGEPRNSEEPSAQASPNASSTTSSEPKKKESKACFPGYATVILQSGRKIPMSDLQVGDVVLTRPGNIPRYSRIHMFSHRISSGVNAMIYLTTTHGDSLILSPLHYIMYLGESGIPSMKTANEVALGDCLISTSATNGTHVVQVDFKDSPGGLYNPHTDNGELVVDGLWVSCYTASLHPAIAHAVLAPLRWVYSAVNVDITGRLLHGAIPIPSRWLPHGPKSRYIATGASRAL